MRLLQRVDLEPVSENYRKTDRDLMSGRTNEQLKLYNYVKLKLACLEILNTGMLFRVLQRKKTIRGVKSGLGFFLCFLVASGCSGIIRWRTCFPFHLAPAAFIDLVSPGL